MQEFLSLMPRFALLAMVLTLVAAPAGAVTIDVTGVDWALGGLLNLYGDSDIMLYAGVIDADLDGGHAFQALSVNLFHPVGAGSYPVVLRGAEWVMQGPRAAWLYVNRLPGIGAPEEGQALQFAIWDIVHDNGDGFASGRVQAATNGSTSAVVLALANGYLDLSRGQHSDSVMVFTGAEGPADVRLLGPPLPGTTLQDRQIDPAAVPEPEAWTLAGAGLLLIFLSGPKRRGEDTSRAS